MGFNQPFKWMFSGNEVICIGQMQHLMWPRPPWVSQRKCGRLWKMFDICVSTVVDHIKMQMMV